MITQLRITQSILCIKVGSAPACYGSSLGSNPNISQIPNGRHKKKSGQRTQARKKYTKKPFSNTKFSVGNPEPESGSTCQRYGSRSDSGSFPFSSMCSADWNNGYKINKTIIQRVGIQNDWTRSLKDVPNAGIFKYFFSYVTIGNGFEADL